MCLALRLGALARLAQVQEPGGTGGEARGRGGLGEGDVAMKGAAKLRPLAKTPGAQFEISIDGTPSTYRDRKAFAIEAAERLKRKHPNSDIVLKDLQSGEVSASPPRQREDLGGLPLARVQPYDAADVSTWRQNTALMLGGDLCRRRFSSHY